MAVQKFVSQEFISMEIILGATLGAVGYSLDASPSPILHNVDQVLS